MIFVKLVNGCDDRISAGFVVPDDTSDDIASEVWEDISTRLFVSFIVCDSSISFWSCCRTLSHVPIH